MKKLISILFVLGFVLSLKPGLKFKDGSESVKIKYSNGAVVSVVARSGRIVLVVTEDGSKRIYIPVENILAIVEE